ncbi:hypothetical protein Asulf_01398 [Archaeoglobus sulfaticallidus PM70-1]|uniref:Uncharacterized protein n=1 Tax=Archaeoglobus sulfaticallidus PM70-1 TaxID=387631 RepID=N0BGG5_9EURY|nr:hypothetical protein [Archaeoglobus sulfaticallidus]AGK61387.1 hypothetical protein Asulf_01398 [Archaeoglobus sulfaticallidus PM70-1]
MDIVESGFNVLISPAAIAVDEAIKIAYTSISCLFIAGNRISILTRIKSGYYVARAFTSHQLLNLLEDSYHQAVFVEHDPSLFETERDAENAGLALRDTAGRCDILVYYSSNTDSYLRTISRYADRVIVVSKHRPGYVADVVQLNPKREVRSFLISDTQLTLEV